MENKKGIVLGMAIAAIVLVATIGGASATDITECTVITTSGTYDITANITNSTAVYCIDIQSDDVIIAGHGHFINGVNTAAGSAGIHYWKHNAVGDNVAIKDVEIKNFDNGIWFEGTGSAKFTNIVVEGCLIHDNGAGDGQGMHLLQVCDSTIKDNEVYNQAGTGGGCEAGGDGIFLKGPMAQNNLITGNTLYNNRKAGIVAKMKAYNNTISDNELWGNGEPGAGETGGILLRCKKSNYNIVEGNNASDNVGCGIYVGGCGNTIRDNNATNNDIGIKVDRCHESGWGVPPGPVNANNTIYDNTFCENVMDIDVSTVSGPNPSCVGWVNGDNNTCSNCSGYVGDENAPAGQCCVHQCETPITDCTVITASGGYYLVNNITNSTAVYCIDIQSDGVIIYGNEHFIDGVNTALGSAGIHYYKHNAVGDNVTIKDVEITNFDNGIFFEGVGSTAKFTNIVVEGCLIHDNGVNDGQGMYLLQVCDSTIKDNEVYNQAGTGGGCEAGGDGIFLKGPTAQNNLITDNTLYNNRKAGIVAKMKAYNNTISDNELWGNGEPGAGETGGILLRCKKSNYNIVEGNNASDNVGCGIYVGGCGNTIRNNNASNNKNASGVNGIGVEIDRCGEPGWGAPPGPTPSANNTLYDNTFCDNEYKDIEVVSDCTEHVNGDNNTCQNCSGYVGDENAPAGQCCVHQCEPLEQPDLIIEDIRPIKWCCCRIHRDGGRGGDDKEGMQVMFLDDPKLAKELGDEKLREEVAEVLAKDPKLAEEIAAKLAGDDEKAAKKLSDPKLLAERCCCRCNAIKELADLLDTELTAEAQHEMSDQLDMIVGCGCCCGGCCCDCCLTAECCCCCCGRFIAYKIANVGDAEAGWSLSNLTVNGRVRSADIVRPLDAGQSRWEVFPCYRMWWWPHWPREVTVCADVTDWVAESDETNNCRTEWWPGLTPIPTLHP